MASPRRPWPPARCGRYRAQSAGPWRLTRSRRNRRLAAAAARCVRRRRAAGNHSRGRRSAGRRADPSAGLSPVGDPDRTGRHRHPGLPAAAGPDAANQCAVGVAGVDEKLGADRERRRRRSQRPAERDPAEPVVAGTGDLPQLSVAAPDEDIEPGPGRWRRSPERPVHGRRDRASRSTSPHPDGGGADCRCRRGRRRRADRTPPMPRRGRRPSCRRGLAIPTTSRGPAKSPTIRDRRRV